MAIIEIPGGVRLPEVPAFSSFTFNTGMVFDAADEAVGTVFQYPKTGNVRKVHFSTGTVTTGATIKVRLETVSTSDGFPTGTPFGTNTVNDAVVVGSGDDNTFFSVTLTADAAVTAGAIAALVIQNPGASVGNMQIRALAFGADSGLPYPLLKQASWAKSGNLLCFCLEYDDGTIVPVPGIVPACSTVTSTNLATNATPDVGALLFTPTQSMRLLGGWVWSDNDGEATLKLVSTAYHQVNATGILATTPTLDPDVRASGSGGVFRAYFTAPYDVVAGTTYRLIWEPTTTTAITLRDITVGSANQLNGWPGGFCLSTAKDPTGNGDWTDFNSGTFRIPMMGLLIAGFDNEEGASSGGSSRSRVQRRM